MNCRNIFLFIIISLSTIYIQAGSTDSSKPASKTNSKKRTTVSTQTKRITATNPPVAKKPTFANAKAAALARSTTTRRQMEEEDNDNYSPPPPGKVSRNAACISALDTSITKVARQLEYDDRKEERVVSFHFSFPATKAEKERMGCHAVMAIDGVASEKEFQPFEAQISNKSIRQIKCTTQRSPSSTVTTQIGPYRRLCFYAVPLHLFDKDLNLYIQWANLTRRKYNVHIPFTKSEKARLRCDGIRKPAYVKDNYKDIVKRNYCLGI